MFVAKNASSSPTNKNVGSLLYFNNITLDGAVFIERTDDYHNWFWKLF